jgi:hypothetical protein
MAKKHKTAANGQGKKIKRKQPIRRGVRKHPRIQPAE